MKDLIARNLDFIAWENFVSPVFYLHWLGALAFAAAFVWTCLLAAGFLRRRLGFTDAAEDVAVSFAVGSACISFFIAFLAFANLLKPWALFLALAVTVALNRRSAASDLRVISRFVRQEPWLIALFVLSSVPVVLPPYSVDETAYHIPYVMDWLRAGGITVSPEYRYPLYTFNFHTLFAAGLMAGSVMFCHVLTWLTGIMGSLIVLVWLRRWGVSAAIAYAAALAFFLSPAVQRYLPIGVVDVPVMFYYLAAVYLLYRWTEGGDAGWGPAAAAALTGAMFLGVKNTGVFFLPLFALWGFLKRPAHLGLFFGAFLPLGLLWNIRSFFISGDPFWPVLNLRLRGHDAFWTAVDLDTQFEWLRCKPMDLPFDLFRIPHLMVHSTIDGPLRDVPLQGFVYLAALSPFLIRYFHARRGSVAVAALLYGGIVWFAVAPHLRYAPFVAVAAVCAGLTADWLSKRLRWAPVTALLVLLMLGPNLNIPRYFKNAFARPLPVDRASHEKFYDYVGLEDMRAMERLCRLETPSDKIYSLGYAHLRYYFEKNGRRLFGEGIGWYRYPDFADAARAGSLYPYMDGLDTYLAFVNRDIMADYGLSVPDLEKAVSSDRRLALEPAGARGFIVRRLEA